MTTTSSGDIELQLADGSWAPLMLEAQYAQDEEGTPLPKTVQGAVAASDADAPISDALVPLVQESWFRGVGLDYDFAPGVDTTDPDYACPAGAATDVALPGGGAGPIVAFAQYGADLFMAQEGSGSTYGRVLRLTGGTGSVSSVLAPATNKYCRGLVVAENGSGALRLYAMFSDGGIQNGEMYAWDGSAWSSVSGSFGTNGRGRAVVVGWRGRDGLKNTAIVTQSGPRKISYTRPNADPMTGSASWIEGVPISTTGELRDFAVSRGHVFPGATDGLFDLNEVGDTPALTSYISEQVQPGNGDAVQYLDGAVYYAFGRGLLKINVEQDGLLSEQPGQCAPGAFLPVEQCPRGYVTAMTTDQGWLVASVFDTTTRTSSVFYGKSREQLGIESPNPMIWHGPLVYFLSDYRVTRMRTSALAGDLRLWIASIGDNSGTPRLSWVSRPLAGTTLQDQYAGGAHRVTTGAAGGTLQPYARMYGLKPTWDDKASKKDLHQHVVGTRGLHAASGTKLTVYTRADPDPGSATWGTGDDVTTGPTQTITPTTVTSGYALQQRIDFFAPDGGATPPKIPYLDSLRTTAWKTAPASNVLTLTVTYGDGVTDRYGGRDESWTPDSITAGLVALTGARTVYRDPHDARWNVRLRQVLDRVETVGTGGPYNKRVTARLQLLVIGAAA